MPSKRREPQEETGALKRRKGNIHGKLTEEILSRIFFFLPKSSVTSCSLVGRLWNRAYRNATFWVDRIAKTGWNIRQLVGESNMELYKRLIKCVLCGDLSAMIRFGGCSLCVKCRNGSCALGLASRHRARTDYLLDELDLIGLQAKQSVCLSNKGSSTSYYYDADLFKLSLSKFGSEDAFLNAKKERLQVTFPEFSLDFETRRMRMLEVEMYRRRTAWSATFLHGIIPLLLPTEHLLYPAYISGQEVSPRTFADIIVSKSREIFNSSFLSAALKFINEYLDSAKGPLTTYASFSYNEGARKKIMVKVVEQEKCQRWTWYELLDPMVAIEGDEKDGDLEKVERLAKVLEVRKEKQDRKEKREKQDEREKAKMEPRVPVELDEDDNFGAEIIASFKQGNL